MGTVQRPDGLLVYDGAQWTPPTAENSGLISNLVYDIALDQTGNVWLATAEGLQRTTLQQAFRP